MKTQLVSIQDYPLSRLEVNDLSMFERWALMQYHPRNLFFRAVSLIWLAYFIWHRDWPSAIFIGAVLNIAGFLSVRDVDLQALSETVLGKLAILHIQPANFTLQIVGLALSVWGLWYHSLEYSLLGLSSLLLGHSFGWKKIDRRFASEVQFN